MNEEMKEYTYDEFMTLYAEIPQEKQQFAEVVQDFDGSFYCNMTCGGRLVTLPEYVTYTQLREATKTTVCAFELPLKKYLHFHQHGRKKYAYVQCNLVGSCAVL